MLNCGIIEPSTSEWVTPIVLVKKDEGSLQTILQKGRRISQQPTCHLQWKLEECTSQVKWGWIYHQAGQVLVWNGWMHSYLGHIVGGGMGQKPAGSEAANFQCLTPRNKKQVRSFLGPTGYYCWVTPDYASIAVPLINLTRKSAPNLVKWDSDCNREDQRVAMQIYREFVRLRLELGLYWARLMMKAWIIQQRISAGSNSPGNNATLQLRKNAWHSNHLCNLFSRANIFQMDYPDGNGSS